jgi:hypothetical protein
LFNRSCPTIAGVIEGWACVNAKARGAAYNLLHWQELVVLHALPFTRMQVFFSCVSRTQLAKAIIKKTDLTVKEVMP